MLFHLPFSTGIFYLSSSIVTIVAFIYAVYRAFKRGDLNEEKNMIIVDCLEGTNSPENSESNQIKQSI